MTDLYTLAHTRPLPPPRKYQNLTNTTLKVLTPEIRKNMLIVKDCVIFGKKRSGKTWLEKTLAEKIVEHYGEENVNVYMSDSLSALVDNLDNPTIRCSYCNKWNLLDENEICGFCGKKLIENNDERVNKKVNVLIIDDPLKRYLSRGGTTKEQREAIGDFEAIAHKLEQKLETREGVAIIIIGSQQYKGLEKTFRDAPVLIFKTTMGDDQETVKRKLNYNRKAIEKLHELTNQIFVYDNHNKKSENIVKVGEKVGYCTFEPYKNDYTVSISEHEKRYKEQQKTKYDTIVKFAKEIIKETSLSAKDVRGIRAYLMKKHPEMVDKIRKLAPAVCDVVAYESRALEKVETERWYSEAGENEDGFVWDYWEEKEKLYQIISKTLPHEKTVRALRAYELYELNAPAKSGRIPRNQEEVANAIVEEGWAEHCTQSRVSQLCAKVKGAVENLKGRKYEFYMKNRLKQEVIKGVFDVDNIKEIIHLGEIKTGKKYGNYTDLIVLYVNGNIDVVSCKCFNKMPYTISIENEKKSDVKPELEMFEKLHKDEKIKLPNGTVLRKIDKVRFVFMLKSFCEQFLHEFYKVYEKPEELPRTLTISKRKIKQGEFHVAIWKKRQ